MGTSASPSRIKKPRENPILLVAGRCIRRGNLDRNTTIELLIPGQPDSRVPPKVKHVFDTITLVAECVTNADGMKLTRLVVP